MRELFVNHRLPFEKPELVDSEAAVKIFKQLSNKEVQVCTGVLHKLQNTELEAHLWPLHKFDSYIFLVSQLSCKWCHRHAFVVTPFL